MIRNIYILLLLSLSFGTVTDIDGNVYETVQIGEQVWMAEDLKTTHYNDGSEIPTGYSNSEWTELETGAHAVYDDDPSNADVYGNLYNWFAVDDDRGLCMDEWHVPSDEEFMELEMYLGMSEEDANSTLWRGADEGSQLAGNSDLWNDGNLENNSEFGTSGFNVLPAGYRRYDSGLCDDMGNFGYFWSSSESSSNSCNRGSIPNICAWYRGLAYYGSNVYRSTSNKLRGFSIRCIQDDIEGCMDSEAINYNADATVDDGTCYYNYPPVANDSEVTMDEDYEVTIYLSATDPEEDVLTFSIVDMPANGTLELSGIAALYIPNADFNGTDSFTFMVNDGMANSNLATVQLTINPVNDPPLLTDEFEDITIYQYDTETIEIDMFYDVDDSLAYSVQTSDVSIASATLVGETLILTGSNYGVTEITVSATDGEFEISDTFSLTVLILGDVNNDSFINVLDIFYTVNMVLAGEYDTIADVNEDGELNVLDVVLLVNWVLYP